MKYTLLAAFAILCFPTLVRAETVQMWEIQSIDTMKISRDRSRDPSVIDEIPGYIEKLSDLNVTHISIGTPYNDEFLPVLTTWADTVHETDIQVWFRGNWAEWEGWFEYSKWDEPNQHHERTREFILQNPDLFKDGDIFTPAPEPENGLIGDPRHEGGVSPESYRDFIATSVINCRDAFDQIGKDVSCTYYSTNGDIAHEVLDDSLLSLLETVTIDHYITDPFEYTNDINALFDQHNHPIVVGEFGAPIPDLHGDMNEREQSRWVQDALAAFLRAGDRVKGVNYWTAFDGSTALFNSDGSPRETLFVIEDYFYPGVLSGQLTTFFSLPVESATIQIGSFETKTDKDGYYSIHLPPGVYELKIDHPFYQVIEEGVKLEPGKTNTTNIFLTPSLSRSLLRAFSFSPK